jgi:hypothetical protein
MKPRHLIHRTLVILFLASLVLVPGSRTHAQQVPVEEGFSAQTVIFEQLDQGLIDYDTSLVYRAYALFDADRLPDQIHKDADEIGEDSGFFAEVRHSWPQLADKTRRLLTPYIVRPTDSRSVFFQPEGGSIEVGAPGNDDEQPTHAGGDCQDTWAAKQSTSFPFKVWVHCTEDYDADLDAAIAMVEEFWEIEVDLMGPPRPDTGSPAQGGDTRLDFYFVEDESDCIDRRGRDCIGEELAHAVPDDPVDGSKASSYIVARREYIGKPEQAIILAHEFFHSLQHAHNWQLSYGFKEGPLNDEFETLTFSQFWFVEATATWMMWHVYRDRVDPAVMQNLVHYRFIKNFDGYARPLYYSPRPTVGSFNDRVYAAYIYFVFLEQEVGPEAVAGMWRQFEDVEADDFAGTLAIIDGLLPFKDHFRDFAVRNLNLHLEPGDPISSSYKDLDPGFPEGIAPPLQIGNGTTSRTIISVTGDDPLTFDDAVPSLSAHYYDFSVTRPVKQLTLDFSGLAANGALDVDMIVKIRNSNWERRQLPTNEPITFCFERGDEADYVSMFYLVLSNHDLAEANTARGTFTISAGDTECTQ